MMKVLPRRALLAVGASLLPVVACVPPPPPESPGRAPLGAAHLEAPDDARIENILRRVTVRIDAASGCGSRRFGSGVIVGDDLVLTNRHVVEDTDVAVITLVHGAVIEGVVESVAARGDDLATIRVEEDLPAAVSLSADDAEVGDVVTLAGFPDPGSFEIDSTEVVGEGPGGTTLRRHQYLALTPRPGHSGSPVLNEDGELVGLMESRRRDTDLTVIVAGARVREAVDEERYREPAVCTPGPVGDIDRSPGSLDLPPLHTSGVQRPGSAHR